MANSALTLYGDRYWISPYVFSAYVALAEKGVDFAEETVALDRRQQHEPAYRDATVTARVPALRHADFWLAESSAIVEYLEDVFPPPRYPRLLPTGHQERARARQVMAWLRTDLLPLREARPTSTMFYEPAATPLEGAGRVAADKLLRVAGHLLDGRTSLFGDFSIADADLAFALHRLLRSGDDVPTPLAAFAGTVWQRPSVRRFVERERPPYVPY